jgi:hypothetical protein
MSQLAKRIADKRVLKLIRAYLRAGILENGLVTVPTEGTPQGGPFTPPTMLQTFLLWARSIRVGTNAKHDSHFLFVNFYTPDQRPNNFALHRPICGDEIGDFCLSRQIGTFRARHVCLSQREPLPADSGRYWL